MNNVGRAHDNGGSRREQVSTIQKISAFTSEKLSLMAVIDHKVTSRTSGTPLRRNSTPHHFFTIFNVFMPQSFVSNSLNSKWL